MAHDNAAESGSNWSMFAGVFLAVVGLFNALEGFVALFQKEYFNEAGLIYENIQAWGWAYLIIGLVQLIAGWLVLSHNSAGRWVGLFIAAISMVVSFAALGAYPWWGLMTIAMNGAVIWGLTARWDD